MIDNNLIGIWGNWNIFGMDWINWIMYASTSIRHSFATECLCALNEFREGMKVVSDDESTYE